MLGQSHSPNSVAAPPGSPNRLLPTGALAVLAPWPTAGASLALLQLLLGPPDAALSGLLLLGLLDPADELVAGQRRDVLPGIERRGVGDQGLAQVTREFVHHPTGHSRTAHWATVADRRVRSPLTPVVEWPADPAGDAQDRLGPTASGPTHGILSSSCSTVPSVGS